MGDWAASTDVSARIPWFTVSASTTPTTTTVNDWIDSAEYQIKGALDSAGIGTDFTGNTRAIAALKLIVTSYVSALILRAKDQTVLGDGPSSEGEFEINKFSEILQSIIESPSIWAARLGAGSSSSAPSRIRTYQTNNSDNLSRTNSAFDPTFKKTEKF